MAYRLVTLYLEADTRKLAKKIVNDVPLDLLREQIAAKVNNNQEVAGNIIGMLVDAIKFIEDNFHYPYNYPLTVHIRSLQNYYNIQDFKEIQDKDERNGGDDYGGSDGDHKGGGRGDDKDAETDTADYYEEEEASEHELHEEDGDEMSEPSTQLVRSGSTDSQRGSRLRRRGEQEKGGSSSGV